MRATCRAKINSNNDRTQVTPSTFSARVAVTECSATKSLNSVATLQLADTNLRYEPSSHSHSIQIVTLPQTLNEQIREITKYNNQKKKHRIYANTRNKSHALTGAQSYGDVAALRQVNYANKQTTRTSLSKGYTQRANEKAPEHKLAMQHIKTLYLTTVSKQTVRTLTLIMPIIRFV